MADSALVIGGTGPTGHYIVRGLIGRGFRVAILHTGRHEVDEIPEDVEHIHTDPFDESALTGAIGNRTFDLTIATYGRLRLTCRVMKGRTGRFFSVGGGPAYRGYMNAGALWPRGMRVPVAEDDPKTRSEAEDGKGYRVLRSENVVFDTHPDATHFRYPYIYGKYQIVPREWSIVRRIIDGRTAIALPDGGLSLNHFGGACNMAHAVLLAVDRPDVAKGQIYNCGDDKVLSLRQVVEVVARALDHDWELVNMPYEWAVHARPMIGQPWTDHRVFDISKIRVELGYRDVVDPVDGLSAAALWLATNPLDARGEALLQDPFDYAAEDRVLALWRERFNVDVEEFFVTAPGYTASYSGPGGSQRKARW